MTDAAIIREAIAQLKLINAKHGGSPATVRNLDSIAATLLRKVESSNRRET